MAKKVKRELFKSCEELKFYVLFVNKDRFITTTKNKDRKLKFPSKRRERLVSPLFYAFKSSKFSYSVFS